MSKGGAVLRLEGRGFELRGSIVLPYLKLNVSAFIVLSARDVLSVDFASDLSECNKSLTIKTVAVVADIDRLTALPLRKVYRNNRPVVDCGFNTNGGRHMGGTFFARFGIYAVFADYF